MSDFEYQRKLAEQRRQRYGAQADFQAPQGQMVSGHFVAPNPLQYLAAGLRSIGGMRGEDLANQEIADIGKREKEMVMGETKALAQALRGTPQETAPFQAPTFDEQDAAIMGQQGMQNVTQAAVPGSYDAFLNRAMQSQLPQIQQIGMQGLLTNAQDQAKQAQQAQMVQRYTSILQNSTPQQAIAAGVPADFVKQYMESANYGRPKVDYKDTGGQLVPVTEFGDTPQGIAPIAKTGNPFSDMLVRDSNGQIVQNAPLVGAKTEIARAGKPVTNVAVNMPDKKFYEGLGTAVSGQIEQTFSQAKAAVDTLNNANQIAQSLETAIVGPLANQRLGLAQIGQALGVAGKDTTEKLENTRNVIQGLARQELAAAGQMKGQGQITESERAILRKAESGQINEFTKPELQTFLSAIRKTARSRVQAHQNNLQTLANDPQAQTVLPYLQLNVPEDVSAKPKSVLDQADAILRGSGL